MVFSRADWVEQGCVFVFGLLENLSALLQHRFLVAASDDHEKVQNGLWRRLPDTVFIIMDGICRFLMTHLESNA